MLAGTYHNYRILCKVFQRAPHSFRNNDSTVRSIHYKLAAFSTIADNKFKATTHTTYNLLATRMRMSATYCLLGYISNPKYTFKRKWKVRHIFCKSQ